MELKFQGIFSNGDDISANFSSVAGGPTDCDTRVSKYLASFWNHVESSLQHILNGFLSDTLYLNRKHEKDFKLINQFTLLASSFR